VHKIKSEEQKNIDVLVVSSATEMAPRERITLAAKNEG